MALYSNYGPDDDSSMTLNQVGRIEQRQHALQDEIEDDIERNHLRYYGQFKKQSRTFDLLDNYEFIEEAIDQLNKAACIQFLTDFINNIWNPNAWSIYGNSSTEIANKLWYAYHNSKYYSETDLDNMYDLVNSSSLNIHDLDSYFKFIYDLKNTDDLHALAEEEY